ncbi:hypothetical protein AKO1_014240 [Acrasis kona]|uniref:C2 domain-containing protein n=1 Tax=Acrasis kona TaxID=1008807 RepID=A0AAW2YZ98_9EUKA
MKRKTSVTPQRSYDTPIQEYERQPTDIKVQIQVIEARNMASIGLFGSTNPYLGVYVATDNFPRCKSKTVKKNLNPRWNEMIEVYVPNWKKAGARPMNIRFEAYGHNQNNPHDFLGQAVVYFKDHKALQTTTGKWTELWLPLEKRTSKDKVSGDLHVGLRCIDLSAKEDEMNDPRRFVDPENRQHTHMQTNFKVGARIRLDDPSNVGLPDYEWSDKLKGLDDDNLSLEERSKLESARQANARAHQANAGARNQYDIKESARQNNTRAPNNKVTARNMMDVTEEQMQDHERSKARKMGLDHPSQDMGQFDMVKQSMSQRFKAKNNQKPVNYANAPTDIDPARCMWRGKGLHDGIRVRAPAAFAVKSFDQNGGEIKEERPQDVWQVEVVGPRDEPLSTPATCTAKPDGLMDVQYTPDQPGLHMIHLHVNDRPVRNSPYQVWVHPVTDPSNSEMYGGPLIEHDLNKKRMGPITLPNEGEMYDGPLTEHDLDKKRMGPITLPNEGEMYDGPLTEQDVNKKKMGPITLPNEGEMYGGPLTEQNSHKKKMGPITLPNNDEMYDGPLTEQDVNKKKMGPITLPNNDQLEQESIPHAIVNDPATFMVQARDTFNNRIYAGGDRVFATFDHPVKDVTVDDKDDGTYEVTFTPTSPGLYQASVRINDGFVKNSPSKIVVKPRAEPQNTTVKVMGIPRAQEPIRIKVIANDWQGNPVNYGQGLLVRLEVMDPDRNHPQTFISAVADMPGTWDAMFVARVPGEHRATVYLNDQPCSTIRIMAQPRAVPHMCLAVGPGLLGGDLVTGSNIPCQFSILARDQDGQPIHEGGDEFKCMVTSHDGDDECLDVIDNNNGTYNVSFRPERPGAYQLNVTLDNLPISNSPLPLYITDGVSAQHSTAEGPGLKRAYANVPASFVIRAKDQHGFDCNAPGLHFDVEVSMRTNDSQSSPQPTIKRLYYQAGGQYPIQYTPVKPGLHQVSVSLFGTPVVGSPFMVPVKDQSMAPSPSHSNVEPSQTRATYRKPYALKVRLKDQNNRPIRAGKDDIKVVAKHVSNKQLDAIAFDVTDHHNGTYDATWMPQYVGEYNLQATLNGVPIESFTSTTVMVHHDADQHHVASVRERTYRIQVCDTEGQEVMELDDQARTGFEVIFYDADRDHQVTNGVMTNVQHVANTGQFLVSYLVVDPGRYLMHVRYYDQAIAQISINCTI